MLFLKDPPTPVLLLIALQTTEEEMFSFLAITRLANKNLYPFTKKQVIYLTILHTTVKKSVKLFSAMERPGGWRRAPVSQAMTPVAGCTIVQ